MELKVKILGFLAGKPIAILNEKTADKINVHVSERINISKGKKDVISLIDTALSIIKEKEVAVSDEIVKELKLKQGEKVEVSLAREPESTIFIRKKLDCKTLDKQEIKEIIKDIVGNALTEAEIAYFVSSIYKCGMSMEEIENMIKAIVSTGKTIKLKGKVVDKHSIGGVAGNRTTPIVVSICAATGLIMPKTSSRAITSAAGTADDIEAIARIEFSIKDLKKIVKKTNACMIWGGALKLSPADDKIIQIERILNLDPESQLLVSILSKKISVGSKYVVIDIPHGKGAKVDKERAIILKKNFEKLAKKFNMKLKAFLTDGSQPIGRGIGPLLEIRDIISILNRNVNSPKDLEEKSLFLAGKILELSGKAKKSKGIKLAKKILDSGQALEKFHQIIKAQEGEVPTISEIESRLGKFKKHILATKSSKIKSIDNKKTNLLGSIAGSPMDKGAGIDLYKHVGDNVKKGEKILTIYSDSRIRMRDALSFYKKFKPIRY